MNISLEALSRWVGRRNAALITSVDADGTPNVKAMLLPRKREGLRVLYFSTNTSSMRVAQYRANPRACVYFYRKGWIRYRGLMLKGSMEVLEDAESKRALWRPGDKLFYPKGVTDPDYCVLRFTTDSARIYQDLHTEDLPL